MRSACDDFAATQERILDAAEKLIRRIGHRKTTVADIACDLGTSRANLYRFFPTRTAIDHDVCARIADTTLEAAREISLDKGPAMIKLAALFETVHRHTRLRIAKEPHIHELLVDAVHGGWDVMGAYFGQMTAIIEAIIREGAGTGELEVENAGEAARGALAAMISFVHPVLVEGRAMGTGDVKAEFKAQMRFVIRALRHGAGTTGCVKAET